MARAGCCDAGNPYEPTLTISPHRYKLRDDFILRAEFTGVMRRVILFL